MDLLKIEVVFCLGDNSSWKGKLKNDFQQDEEDMKGK